MRRLFSWDGWLLSAYESATYSWLQSAELSFIEVCYSRLKLIAFGRSIKFWGKAHDNKGSKARCIIAGVDSNNKAAPGERPYMTAQCEVK